MISFAVGKSININRLDNVEIGGIFVNYYERIQKSIDYIEDNLTRKIYINRIAEISFFSSAQFYRIFFALTGFSIKSYIRKRRIYEAAKILKEKNRAILDIAIEYQFESQESFTRALKKELGITPGILRKEKIELKKFEKVNLIKQYSLDNTESFIDPKIKVLRKLPKMRVAYYSYIGENPEKESWRVLIEWAKSNNIIGRNCGYRLFGFDLPEKKQKIQYTGMRLG